MAIWRRKRRHPSAATERAAERLQEAAEHLEAARADDDPVDHVAGQLQELARRNHFGPMITKALRGSR